MTVKEVVRLLKTAKSISLGYGANAVQFDPRDTLVVEAYGDFVVDEIQCEDGHYEVIIAMRPVKGVSA